MNVRDLNMGLARAVGATILEFDAGTMFPSQYYIWIAEESSHLW